MKITSVGKQKPSDIKHNGIYLTPRFLATQSTKTVHQRPSGNTDMKNDKWLDVTEYALLAGSGIGSIASIATQQIAYTAAPVSFLMMLNVMNRQRLDQQVLDQSTQHINQVDARLNKQMEILDRRIQGLPTFWDLASLRKTLMQKNRVNLNRLHEQLSNRLAAIEVQDVGEMKGDLNELQTQQARLLDSIDRITVSLRKTPTLEQFRDAEGSVKQLQDRMNSLQNGLDDMNRAYKPSTLRMLQGQIDYINRRFNAMPNPADTASLKQDVEGMMQLVSELVPRREMTRLVDELDHLRQRQDTVDETVAPIRLTMKILRQQVTSLMAFVKNNADFAANLHKPETTEAFTALQDAVSKLQQQIEESPSEDRLVELQTQLESLVQTKLDPLKDDLKGIQSLTQSLEQQQQHLNGWMNRLPEMLDFSALRNQMKYLSDRMERSEMHLEELGSQVVSVSEGHPGQAPAYELMFDLQASVRSNDGTNSHSRSLIDTALEEAQSHLMIVFPSPDRHSLDANLLHQFRAFLERGGKLDIGWGYMGDLQQNHAPRYIHQRSNANPTDKSFLQNILSQFTQLKRQYPEQFRFKVLGTDENFLVCDRSYALLGFQPITVQSAAFPRVAVGLKTYEASVMQGLVDRFENPVLTENDTNAYFNRALTRYELDDKQGAIADYSQVIQINPDHDTAYNNCGLVRYELGNKEGAVADLNRAILINPCNSIAFCNRGIIRAELGNPMGAIEDYSYAIHANASCAPAYFQRGLARSQMGNKMGAVEDFTDVISLNDQDASAYFYRGMARTKLGDRIGAIRDLKESAKLFQTQGNTNSHQQAINAISRLQKSLVIDGAMEGVARIG
jgi:tetratricopeptide (TPR) repeat protein